MSKKARLIIRAILGIASIIIGILIYQSIMEPVHFLKEKKMREKVLVQRLKDIRTTEIAYKSAHGRYIGDIDSIIVFLKDGKLPFINKIGMISDSLLATGMTETQAVKLGIIRRDTTFENAYQVLFPNEEKATHLANLIYIPFNAHNTKIDLRAGYITKIGYKVPVFISQTPFEAYMSDMDKQELNNLRAATKSMNRYPGVQMGSLTEAITTGNWE